MLNSSGRFTAPAFAPVASNVVIICTLVAAQRVIAAGGGLEGGGLDSVAIGVLGLGSTLGVAMLLLVIWPSMAKAGIRVRFRWDLRDPVVMQTARLSGWVFGYVLVNQLSLWVLITLVNGATSGGPAAYSYAWQFFQVPYGLFTVAVVTVFLPRLSVQASRRDLQAFRRTFVEAFRMVLLVTIPATFLFLVLAEPIVELILHDIASIVGRGHFDGRSVALTGSMLRLLACGLPGFSAFLFSLRGFYAFRDTKVPFLMALGQNGLQIGTSIVLVAVFGWQGALIGFSASYTVAGVVGVALVARRVGGFGRGLVASLVRFVLIGAAMAVAMKASSVVLAGSAPAVSVLGGIGVGSAVYAVGLRLLCRDDIRVFEGLWRQRARNRRRAIRG